MKPSWKVPVSLADAPDDELRIADDDLRGLPSLIGAGLRDTAGPIISRELKSAINAARGRLDE